MDILDIDEMEDEFGIFEEKMQDDVTNILKQWKIGNNKKDAVFDSRTFTRPKGSIIRNSVDGLQLKSPQDNQNGMCMKIGGLVSNVQKSFLNDISPPNSICSSINIENETISNSLITSADFSSISFFKTSLMDSNIDFAFKNNLKQYNNIEPEIKHQYDKNIPTEFYNNDITMKSSVSKDHQHNNGEKHNTEEEDLNLLTDSTKENSPICHQIDNESENSFQSNTQVMSNTFKKRNLTYANDTINTIETEERPIDINKTFLRKPKMEPQLNKTFDKMGLNISNIKNKPLTQNLNETQILKAIEKNKTFDSGQINLVEGYNSENVNSVLPPEEKVLNNFEFTTSTPQKYIENEIGNTVDFTPTPVTSKLNYYKHNQSNEDNFSSNESLVNISEKLDKCKLKTRTFNKNISNLDNDDLDLDNLSDLSDKIENFKEDALKKSVENIKKRYSHKFDKSTHNTSDKLNIQKISNPFPENGRLLSRRSRLNDNLVLNENIINENEKQSDQNIEIENNQFENNLNNFELNKSENLVEKVINNVNSEQHQESNYNIYKKEDEKDIDAKRKLETKRLRNDDRFKTIKINRPFAEQYKEEFLDINETECNSPTAFARIDKNAKIMNFEKEPLKLDNKLNAKIKQPQVITNERTIPGLKKNLKYERISKIENLGKAISASNLESATKNEQNENFKFAIPAPVKQIKSPMGTKAKSFHNLASNNFGFGLKRPSIQISSKNQENSFLPISAANTSAKTRNNDSPRKTGLIRPSSGYFSRGAPSEVNILQATFISDEKNTKTEANCSKISNNCNNSEPNKINELNSIVSSKLSKQPTLKPVESKLPTNIKRSGLPRPSAYYRK